MATRRRRIRGAAGDAGKVKTAFTLSPEAIRRLGVVCAMEQVERSAWLEGVIMEKARRWVISDRARPPGGESVLPSPGAGE